MQSNNEYTDLLNRQQKHLRTEYDKLRARGCTRFDFLGGRRSGKTYFILQRLLSLMAQGYVISVASMTNEQGRLGAFQDARDIIDQSPSLAAHVEIRTSPMEIRCDSGGRMFFKSYAVSERAKGIACDYLYINEANNFTEQQYTDLAMSVRRSIFADRNPNTECWTTRNGFALIHSTWQHNADNLTDAQKEEFAKLKAKAESPNATSADIAFYRMYYLGEYAEITGNIFTPANIQRTTELPNMDMYFIYADSSALCGADYFACVCCGCAGGKMYVVNVRSTNVGSRHDVAEWMDDMCHSYDIRHIWVEGNGLTGKNFYEEQRSSFPNLRPYTNTENKHGRILGNYEAICSRVVFADTEEVQDYLKQVYDYEGKEKAGKHDDNIDAVNSAYEIAHRFYRMV